MPRRPPAVIVATILLLPIPALAAALTEASPSADSVARGAPDAVELTFDAAVQPRLSAITVKSDGGKRMDRGRVTSVGDARHLAISIKVLLPGHYRVDWRVVAADGHRTSGSYGFTAGQ